MSVPTMDGVREETLETVRIRTRVLFAGERDGVPVLFLHGNLSSATWWEETMLRLPRGYRGIAFDQRGYGDADPDAKVDATLGGADLAEDAVALLDHLSTRAVHAVGSSLGASVIWRLLADWPARLLSATLVAPGSPYGFGGTKDTRGTPCHPDFAGSGGGLINRELARRLASGDRTTESVFSPRAALRALVWRPPFVPAREEDLLSATLSTHTGDRDYPGDSVPSPNWPHVAPGRWGASNALSPKYALAVDHLLEARRKLKILWLRGESDLAVSNRAASDPGTLGQLGLIPGWPGPDVYPSQPMLDQTRAVLERYAKDGGGYQEVVLPECGHAPYLERPSAFDAALHAHLESCR